jgi:hypothetical protein
MSSLQSFTISISGYARQVMRRIMRRIMRWINIIRKYVAHFLFYSKPVADIQSSSEISAIYLRSLVVSHRI